MSFTVDNCQLEVDTDRGVIYVHSDKGMTLLRICGVKPDAPLPDETVMLDVTLKWQNLKNYTFSW